MQLTRHSLCWLRLDIYFELTNVSNNLVLKGITLIWNPGSAGGCYEFALARPSVRLLRRFLRISLLLFCMKLCSINAKSDEALFLGEKLLLYPC